MKNILIALDCTSFAKQIVLAGKELAIRYPGVSIFLVHALLQPEYYSSAQYAPILGFNEYYNKDLSDFLDGDTLNESVRDFFESLKEELSLPDARIIIQPGEPEKVLAEAILEKNADILVIGKQNLASGAKKRIGHITEAVLKQTSIPVYVVPTLMD